MKTALFVQARLNSNRIAQKMLKTLYKDKTIIYLALQATNKLCYDDKVLLIPYGEAQYFKDVAKEFGFFVIEGPENDVLGRFITGISSFPNAEFIIRGCADKVVYDSFYQNIILKEQENNLYDMIYINDNPVKSVTAEIYRTISLIAADMFYPWNQQVFCADREHIKPLFFKGGNGMGSSFWTTQSISITDNLKELPINISIDTEEDLERMKRLFSDLYTGTSLNFIDVLDWFAKNK